MRIAAIDQGTTSTRALVADEEGRLEVVRAVQHRQSYPQQGFVEHDPLELLENIRSCIDAVGSIDALGIDNQGESCLAWDAVTGAPLSPVIVWQDNRTATRTDAMKREGQEALTLAKAGLPLDPYFSASKLAWLVDEVPEVVAARKAGRLRLGTTDAFFIDRLAGTFATDATTASRTSLMNLETGMWDDELCALFGVPMECLPEIRDTVGDFGGVDHAPLTAAVVDQQAALYGHGCRKAGEAKITFGTGAFALAVTEERIVRASERGLLPTVAWSIGGTRSYAVDGGVYDAGAAVDWARRAGLVANFGELSAFEALPAIDRGLTFVPALSGLACPHWDRSAAAIYIGMSGDTTRADLQQALLEGIALRTAEVVSAIDAEVPVGRAISVDGGLSRSPYFVQFLADCLGRMIVTQDFDELTAYGTAALAAHGIGAALREPGGGSGRQFEPRPVDRQARASRFGDAVRRSSKWR